MMIDRLSILALKIFHTREESMRDRDGGRIGSVMRTARFASRSNGTTLSQALDALSEIWLKGAGDLSSIGR